MQAAGWRWVGPGGPQASGGVEPGGRGGPGTRRAGARCGGAAEGRGRRAGDMSGGSSCSQTPSRAIPTRRVALGDGVQLPPGDYSTTPGGTLFSTTPGGRCRPGSPVASGAGDTLGSGVARATGVAAGRTDGRTGGVGTAEWSLSRLPAFWVWWSAVWRRGCKLPALAFSLERQQSAPSTQIGTLPGSPCAQGPLLLVSGQFSGGRGWGLGGPRIREMKFSRPPLRPMTPAHFCLPGATLVLRWTLAC